MLEAVDAREKGSVDTYVHKKMGRKIVLIDPTLDTHEGHPQSEEARLNLSLVTYCQVGA